MMHGVPHVHQAHRVRRDDIIIGHVVQSGRVDPTRTDLVVREKLAVVVLLAVCVEDRCENCFSEPRFAFSHGFDVSL